jgi:phosphoribosyl 1,2-cyclic phosphodiesterase
LEVRCGEHLIILDAGTGIRYLGQDLDQSKPIDADVFLTHTHFDHVCGIPFFGPFYNPNNTFRIWAGHLMPEMTIEQVLVDMMMAPLFPVPLKIFAANMSYHDFPAGETVDVRPGVSVRTAKLNHPNRATGYRIDYQGKSFCYLTDTEHVANELDQNILELIQGADYVAYDGMYTDDEYPNRVGWGHSTWQEGVRLCEAADVKTFVLFHHDPDHNDDFLDDIGEQLEARRPGSVMAREGLVIDLI